MVTFYTNSTTRMDAIADANDLKELVVRPAYLVHLALVDDNDDPADVYVNSTVSDLTFGGNSYLGVGRIGQINTIEEGAENKSYGTELVLNGVPQSYINEALVYKYRERECIIYLVLLNEDNVIQWSVQVFQGRIDTMDIDHGLTGTITVKVENVFVDWERTTNKRTSYEDHRNEYPNDKGLEFLAESVEKEILWGYTA